MDESVRAAMAKWPDVPGVHGWLSLDESGHWRLKGETITHAGLIAFINRNYECDERGRWYFQNGPQRGYVELAYTPWVLHVDADGDLCRHTGDPVDRVTSAWIDDEGHLLLDTPAGVGLVDSDALPAVAEWFVDADGRPAESDALEAAFAAGPNGGTVPVRLVHAGRPVEVGLIQRAEVPSRFGFVAQPSPDEA